ncbi:MULTISPECIES: metal-dependent hydrolase [unclassified Leptospira]|uniref:metal-dependent hydrolase n=1 Tax=unclassified Leptospira TaxID=2633828 RepID=UPI0002C02CD9|nr:MULTISPECIES: metal-dependent hydrolase [unclassified Leptospira]EMK00490.1 putative membrane-bound metal-dependent hydrolase [Leptospira sp. B5-022]MCR1792993.1 metal-dependent hydrolase [Leptospira sp. id769339]
MATIFSHPAVPISLFFFFGKKRIPVLLAIFGIFFSVLPDFDVVAFKFGIPYESDWGHRGFTHSILFALVMSCIVAFFKIKLKVSWLTLFSFLFVSTVSHGVLDAMTTGGLGVGFLIPWSSERTFFEFRPIRVSPIGPRNFFTARGWVVIQSELLYIWIPAILVSIVGIGIRWFIRKTE